MLRYYVLFIFLLLQPTAFADQAAFSFCQNQLLSPIPESLHSLLKRPSTLPKDAISTMLKFIALEAKGNGLEKHKLWMEMVSIYNDRRTNNWITSPCIKTEELHVACWGETRGHLLVFENSGLVFKSYNPLRPNPQSGPSGFYVIDWDDPTLKQIQ